MADFFTHILCADEVLDKIHDGNVKNIIRRNLKLYYLGAQGPDIFYYNNIFNKEEKKLLNDLGDMLHVNSTEMFFEESFMYLKNVENRNEYENLLVYLLGFLTHFSLDSSVHPYIYYNTGFYDKNNKKTRIYNSYHKKLEIIIDVLMMKLKKNEKAYKLPTYKLIDNGKSLPLEIETYFQFIIKKVYNQYVTKKAIGNNYIFMKRYQKLLYDPKNIKKYFVLFTIKLFKWTKYYFYTFYPKRIDKMDYLNLNKKLWNHPVTGEIFNTSFIDLFNQGVKRGVKYSESFIKYLYSRDQDLIGLVPDISYLTALPCSDKREMKIFDIIFKRYKEKFNDK